VWVAVEAARARAAALRRPIKIERDRTPPDILAAGLMRPIAIEPRLRGFAA
jgi:hypothetical protein